MKEDSNLEEKFDKLCTFLLKNSSDSEKNKLKKIMPKIIEYISFLTSVQNEIGSIMNKENQTETDRKKIIELQNKRKKIKDKLYEMMKREI